MADGQIHWIHTNNRQYRVNSTIYDLSGVSVSFQKSNDFCAVVTYQAEKSETGDDAVSAGIFYGDNTLKSGPLFAALAQDFDVKGYDVTRASLQYRLGDGKLGVMLQRQEPAIGGESRSGGFVSYSHRVGKFDIRSQFQTMEDDRTVDIGLDYHLGSNTKIYAWLASIDEDEVPDRRYLALGVEHKLAVNF
ncbi:porin [Lacimicrobium alkaliphilum]|uniref:porin n=1 Tax=Lacimicrobium alkaliphilum TaxID=1526571 RepID=UPI0009EC17E1|nr:porin [Lacimicrobium alkaliphilum]